VQAYVLLLLGLSGLFEADEVDGVTACSSGPTRAIELTRL
jgi:hypothetical protein